MPRYQPLKGALRAIVVLLAASCTPLVAVAAGMPADDAPQATTLQKIVVTATRSEADAFDVPASIDSVDVDAKLRLGASPAELLGGLPGVVARDRQNYAQDTQISIRGFGARSTFGIRGIRLYTDGIPATQPDGQGQVSHFNLDSAERIEVLRGPFSALYGNASGGVIQSFTADGKDPPELRAGVTAGRFGALRTSVNANGKQDGFDYNLDYSRFRTDGYRDHSAAERNSFNAKLGLDLDSGGHVTLVGNVLRQPYTQDPLGITRAQFDQDPHQTASVATQFDTRKRADQAQAGVIYDQAFADGNRVRAMFYGGTRDIVQYLAIPASAQAAPGSAGGVVDLGTGYGGTDVRWSRTTTLNERPLELSAGVTFDTLHQHRRGYENFAGDVLGVRGNLRRDEIDTVQSFDQYVQADWRFADAWSLLVGARHSRVAMVSGDRYIAAGNPDDSGSVDFSATTPVAGLMFRATDALHLYASFGRAFETPTFAEVGYRSDGGAGLAFDLRPVKSRNGELGAKWRANGLEAQLAVFQTESDDELAVATSNGGRTTYQNIGSSRRRGAELSTDWAIVDDWSLEASYAYLDARFTSAFLGCSARCAQPDTPVSAGTRIAGVPRDTASMALRWQPSSGWNAAVDAAYSSDLTVNDFGSESAPSYVLYGAEVGHRWALRSGELRAFVRGDNLADRDYVGSVIVNDANGRYYEPGPGRTWLVGLQWRGKQ